MGLILLLYCCLLHAIVLGTRSSHRVTAINTPQEGKMPADLSSRAGCEETPTASSTRESYPLRSRSGGTGEKILVHGHNNEYGGIDLRGDEDGTIDRTVW